MDDRTDGKHQNIKLERFPHLNLAYSIAKGRGVFAGKYIPSGTTVDTCPVLLLDPVENSKHIEQTSLYHYTYNWPTTSKDGKPAKTQAVIFGLGSMFNHSTKCQNVGWKRDLQNNIITYRALRDIQEDEELCISYGNHLTFVDADNPHENGAAETEEDHLGRIQLEDIT